MLFIYPHTAFNTFSHLLWLSFLFVCHNSYFIQGCCWCSQIDEYQKSSKWDISILGLMGCCVYIRPMQRSSQLTFTPQLRLLFSSLVSHMWHLSEITQNSITVICAIYLFIFLLHTAKSKSNSSGSSKTQRINSGQQKNKKQVVMIIFFH